MATKNRKSNLPVYPVHSGSALKARSVDKQALPRHIITGIYMRPEILLEVHTAGRDKLWSMPVMDASVNKRLIHGMCSEDALLVGVWYGEAKQRRLYQELAELQCNRPA